MLQWIEIKNCPTKCCWFIGHLQTESFNINIRHQKQFHFAKEKSSQKAPFQLRFVIRDQQIYAILVLVGTNAWNQHGIKCPPMTGIAHLPAMGPVTSATIGTPTFATERNPAPLGRKNLGNIMMPSSALPKISSLSTWLKVPSKGLHKIQKWHIETV